MNLLKRKNDICNMIVNYLKDVDPYEFRDVYDNNDQAFEETFNELTSSNGINRLIKFFIEESNTWLEILIDDKEDKTILKYANDSKNILKELHSYYNMLKKLEKER